MSVQLRCFDSNQPELTTGNEEKCYNPFFRFMSRFVMGYYSSINDFFTALAASIKTAHR
jgi:hypothetical protein